MPEITVYKDSKVLQEIKFTDFVNIGRRKSNDIVLESTRVSAVHASIIKTADGVYALHDRSSRNGIEVGGELVSHYPLSHGAVFRIAEYRLLFVDQPESQCTANKVQLSGRLADDNKWEQDAQTAIAMVDDLRKKPAASCDPQQRLSLILALSTELVSILDYHELMEKALDMALEVMDAERGFLAVKNEQGELVYSATKGFDEKSGTLRVSSTMISKVMGEGRAVLTDNAITEEPFSKSKSVLAYKLKSIMCVPLSLRSGVIGCIYVDNPRKVGSFSPQDLEFLTILSHQIAVAVDNARLHKKLRDEKDALQKQLRLKDDVIVRSPNMLQLFEQVQRVAQYNTSVLILGETGTGKEVVAKALHEMSCRTGPFVPMNCSAIPPSLLESELFGYEKGGHSTAVTAKPGLFEMADKGTIFLDEIGDMGVDLQTKLLRVLQEKEIMRLGGTKPRRVDIRVVAATNRDLKAMIKVNDFREDLYYRLAEFELRTFPLRERKEEIPVLLDYFLLKFCAENNCSVPRISDKAMQRLTSYPWPGNVRQLKNVVQKAAIKAGGAVINSEDLPEELSETESNAAVHFPSLEEMERRHIAKAIERAGGNKKKAAELLGIARDTMYKKLEKYRIG